ncbi:MAG: site-specific DNA-methyltransferase [Myxococcota bacterium]|nr:site-specific DNA-methyltransferase [Myxococcota bacterium]
MSPRLVWAGQQWAVGVQTAGDAASARGTPPVTIEMPGEPSLRALPTSKGTVPTGTGAKSAPGGATAWIERLVEGDAFEVAQGLGLAGRVDLVYVDPPFASQATYEHEARLDGPADGRVVRARAYDDRWGNGLGPYLDMLAPRLEALAHLLSRQGTIWVHVDWRASHLVRMLLDEIMGREAFKNEIVWRRAPNLGRQAASNQFGRTLDTIIVYGKPGAKLTPPTRLERIDAKAIRRDDAERPYTTAPRGDYTDESLLRLEQEGRVHRTASGKAYVKYFLVQDAEGTWCRERRVDTLWTDVAPLRHARTAERTGFPTQKPRALLDRIVACASPPGGVVVDLFAGSGTTGESAHSLGRQFVLGDASPLAIATARARLLRAGSSLVVQRCGQRAWDEGAVADAVDFAVERSGEGARVFLRRPLEPLAWAIDVRHDPASPFRTAWHAERAPGVRPRAAPREATLLSAPGPIAVRAWWDDGRVATGIEGTP